MGRWALQRAALGVVVACAAACNGDLTGGGGGGGGGNGGGGGGDDDGTDPGGGGPAVPPGVGDGPPLAPGDSFFGTAERFNRYYTDPDWEPLTVLYASPSGGGDGSSADTPTTLEAAVGMVEPGTRVELAAGTYEDTCIELTARRSGTYEQPIVFAGRLADDGSPAVRIECCGSGRASCFNLESANYVAVDSVELIGGRYGVRAVGSDFAADEHQVGIAVLRSIGHDQTNDPFFSGQSDWFVIERVVAHDAGEGDGHGIYLSNGSDWLIVRGNELFANQSSDLQINADPILTCAGSGIDYVSPECDAVAGEHPTGGRGATDFALIERNYFHDGFGQGANFTSVRNSLIRNNVFSVYRRHGVSFWQETDNPALGSRGNKVLQNLFATTNGQHALQFINSSDGNTVAQNLLLGVSLGSVPRANANALLLQVDGSVVDNVYSRNAYIGGRIDGRSPGDGELRQSALDPSWFADFPVGIQHSVDGFTPRGDAPWASAGQVLADSPADMLGKQRTSPTSLGPLSR